MPSLSIRKPSPAPVSAVQALRRARLRAGLLYWVLIPAATIGNGWLCDRWLPTWQRDGLTVSAGLLLFGTGVALVQKATGDLARFGDGTPAPQAPARRLVTTGSYAWCRHPMFLGYDLAAWGVALLLASPGMLLISLPVMLFLQVRFLYREEMLLEKRFHQAWRDYRERVPLLVPRPFPSRGVR
jgi:protein-S-isoprenylcysteine O-methyltransferase Ste14